VVLLRKSIPQNHNLQTAAELGVTFFYSITPYNFEGVEDWQMKNALSDRNWGGN
jgi:hypothetical protein